MLRQALLLLSRPGLAIAATLLLSSSLAPVSSAQEKLSGLTGIGESWVAQNSSSAEGSEEGDRLLQEGWQLFQQGTAESLRQALPKLEAARQAYHAAGDAAREAITLLGMGRIYNALGDKQTALDYYNQSLPLFRQVGDKAGEAGSLNNIGRVYSDLGDQQTALDYYNQSLPLTRQVGDKAQEATTLNNIGLVYDDLGDKQTALDYLNQSLPLRRQVGDKAGEATTLNNIGGVYSDLGDKQTALDYYNQSLPLFRQVGDKAGEATTLNNIGGVYSDLGDKQTALDYYNQSLPLRRQVGDKAQEARTLNNIGQVYSDLGDKQTALDYLNQSLPLRRQVGDKAGEAVTLNNIGRVYYDLGDKQTALDYYNQSLPLSRQVGDISGEAGILSNIGRVYDDLGEKQTALDYYNQSLPLRRQVGDISGEAFTLNNIGAVYDALGDKQTALDYLNQSLPLFRQVGDKAGEAVILNNIGEVYSDLGDQQTALDYYNQSLPLRRQVGDKAGEAGSLNNIGGVYFALGDKQTALDYYNQSLPLFRQVGDKAGEATTLSNIGVVYNALGDQQTALDYLNQSLPLRRLGDKAGEATTLNNIGRVYDDLGDQQTALDYYNQSLPLFRQVGDKAGEAGSLNNIGRVYNDLGDQQTALDYLNQSLPLTRQVGDKAGEARTLYNLSVTKRSQGNLTEALTDMEASIALIEDLRTKIDSEKLRQSYFAQNQNSYEFYIDLLMQLHQQNPDKGYDKQAFNASERARARTLLEILAEANADIRTGVDPELREKEANLQQRINATAARQIELLSAEHTDEQATALKQELENLLRELDAVKASIRQTSPRYAALTQPQPLTAEQIQQQVLDENTLLLQYSLGENRSFLWAVTPDSLTAYELPPRAEIEKATREFRDAMTAPTQRYSPPTIAKAAANLSQMVLAPVADRLSNKRLLIVSDGALHYVPFAALSHPTIADYQPLMLNREVIALPSSSSVAVLREQIGDRSVAPKTLAIFADPVFSAQDDRITGSGETIVAQTDVVLTRSSADMGISGTLARLKFTRDEAEAILTLIPDAEILQAFDFEANRQTIISEELSQYRVVHFATHGFLNSVNPELSGIVLSLVDPQGNTQDGFLRLHDIFNLTLNADLVVLSACNTGLGDSIRGEGLVGLTRGFMYAGVPRLVVSLWSVDDEATAILMSNFYVKMLSQNLTPAQALRQAQVEMSQTEEWKSPYFWAGFTLQGEWR